MIKKRKIDTHAVRFEKKDLKKVSKFTYSFADDNLSETQNIGFDIEKNKDLEMPFVKPNNEITNWQEISEENLSFEGKIRTTKGRNEKTYSWNPANDTSYKKGKKTFRIKSLAFLACCFLIGRARWGIFSFVKSTLGSVWSSIGNGARTVIGNVIGTKAQTDAFGNINVAILGYGGAKHAWWYLTDAIIIASINTEKGTMSMLSIPRDLRVKKPSGTYGKINSVFQDGFFGNWNDYEKAAPSILGKLTEITNIDLHYYAFVDFDGFEEFINSIGWIEIDVPEPIYDSQYPWENNSYITFSIDSGNQILDGATALMYARSRHSTSDFSRSRRQQEIIDWVMNKVISAKMLFSPGKIEDAYKNVTKFIHTNVTLDEMLRLVPFAKSIDHKSSWQIAVCWASRRDRTQPGCLLYTPPMEAMWWASTEIPVGATPANPSNYSVIHSFVKDVVLDVDTLAEKATIRVLNWLSTGTNKIIGNLPLANNIAVDFIKEWFIIFDVGNTTGDYTQTTILTNGKGREASLEKIKRQLPPFLIQEWPIVPDWPSLTVILGDDMVVNGKAYPWSKDIPEYLHY